MCSSKGRSMQAWINKVKVNWLEHWSYSLLTQTVYIFWHPCGYPVEKPFRRQEACLFVSLCHEVYNMSKEQPLNILYFTWPLSNGKTSSKQASISDRMGNLIESTSYRRKSRRLLLYIYDIWNWNKITLLYHNISIKDNVPKASPNISPRE